MVMIQMANEMRKNTSKKKCCAKGCQNDSGSKTLFTFPKVLFESNQSIAAENESLQRCLHWIKSSGNTSLLQKDPSALYGRFFLCCDHFNIDQYSGFVRKRLKPDSCPQNFVCDSLSTEDMDMYSRNLNSQLKNKTEETQSSVDAETNIQDIDEHLESSSKAPANVRMINQSTNGCIRRKCSAPTCQNNNLTSNLHTFPCLYTSVNGVKVLDNEKMLRCRNWIKYTANINLLSVHPSSLHNHVYLCNNHFMATDFNQKESKLLKRSAVPTLFTSKPISESRMEAYDIQWKVPKDLSSTDPKDSNSKSVLQKHNNGSPTLQVQDSHSSKDITELETTNTLEYNEQQRVDDTSVVHSNISKRSTKKKRIRSKCCFKNCSNNNLTSTLFTFPSLKTITETETSVNKTSLIRCYDWLKATGNKVLLQLSPFQLQCNSCICCSHFSNNQFKNLQKKHLRDTAIPESHESPLTEEEMECYKQQFALFSGDSYSEYEQTCLEVEYGMKFDSEVEGMHWFVCSTCNERQLKTKNSKDECSHHNQCVYYSVANNMDPGTVPPELQDLTYIEEQLIARVHPLVSVFKLRSGGQFAYSGNVISFPQDIQNLARVLPYKLKDITSVVKVRFENESGTHHDFQVRSKKVYSALKWLTQNNIFYKDVVISEENLSTLPENDNVYKDLTTISTTSSPEDKEINEAEEPVNQNVQRVHQSAVPISCAPHPDEQIKATLDWPSLGKIPVNEFKTPGYVACAFPTLFPDGAADLRDSRLKKVTPSNYFKHLLHYHDNRFSQHATFRFFAMNSLMRWTALTDGNIFVKNSEDFKNMTTAKLRDVLQEKPSTIKKIMYRASNLRGTKPYWRSRCFELRQMVEQLGLPTFFLTLSFADYHYKDLFRLLTDRDVITLTEADRRKLLQDNPLIVDMFFSQRIELFIKYVLKPRYNVLDFWYRVEYQHRGSPHLHGLFWMANAPDVSNIQHCSEEQRLKIKEYFNKLISAINPNQGTRPPETHPCRKSFKEIINKEDDLAQLLNTVQRHTKCSSEYCLKYKKKEHRVQCRFNFPFDLQDESTLLIGENNVPEYVPARNDPYLNKYNSFIIQVWRANIDIAPVVSKEALVSYLVKYIGKSETSSSAMDKMLNSVLLSVKDTDHVRSAIQRLFMRVCAERDFSAQEVCHILLGLKLYSSGGTEFTHINFPSPKNDWIQVDPETDESQHKRGKSTIEKYTARPSELENISLWIAATQYNTTTWKKINKVKIALIYPKFYKKEGDDEVLEKFYRQEVLLHKPWRTEEDFHSFNLSWKEIYLQAGLQSTKTVGLDMTKSTSDSDSDFSEESESEDNESHHIPQEEWMLLCRLGPNTEMCEVELGRRELDINNDWNAARLKYAQYGHLQEIKSYITRMKEKVTPTNQSFTNDFPNVTFNNEQQAIVTLIDKQISHVKTHSSNSTHHIVKKVIIQGKAGTGKSLVIKY